MKPGSPGLFYIFIGLLFSAMLFITFRFFSGDTGSTIGVTYAKDYKINAEKSTLIKAVHVVSGQQVKTGDLLVELSSYGLEMDLDILQNRINNLKSELQERSKLVNADIAYAKAEHDITISKIDADISEIESELKLNGQLTKNFTNTAEITDHSQDPLQLRVSSLEGQKGIHKQATNIKIGDMVQKNKTEQVILNNQIILLERELALLKEEKNKLAKYATFDGVIETVYVKGGEEVDAFSPLVSLNPAHPSTVVGYLMGRREREILSGAFVTIASFDQHKVSIPGEVIGFGSVVQLPDILQKSTAVKAFGREVFIKISEDNTFATGQKVLIK